MDLGANADGELLQRALEGEQVSEPGILELVAVLHAVQAVDQAGLAPRAEFVSDLRARLLADDATEVTPLVPLAPADPIDGDEDGPAGADAAGAADDGPRDGGTVSILRVAARPLKFIAAAAASILVIGGALGFASRSAVPGDALYGVKQLLDRVAVQLAGSRYDQGLTYLAQTILMEVYRTEQRTEALTELSDFYARAIPQVDAMRPRVPAASLPAWQRLRNLLGAGDVATLRELAACGACGERATSARQTLASLTGAARPGSPGSGTPAPPGALPSQPGGVTLSRPPQSAPPLPGASVPPVTGLPLPGGTVNLPGVGVGSSSVGLGGGGVTLPGATASLPHVGITSSTIGIGGGGATLPGATISVPSVTLGVPLLPTKVLPT